MAIPDFQTLMLPILRTFGDRRWRNAELIDEMVRQFAVTAEERSAMLPSGRQRLLDNRTHWAINYLFQSGLIIRLARGVYEISDRGRQVLCNPPSRIDLRFLKQFLESEIGGPAVNPSVNGIPESSGSGDSLDATATPEEKLEHAASDLRRELGATLLARVQSISPRAFEYLILDLLKAMGYGDKRDDAIQHLGMSGDEGIDGVIRQDKLGLDSIYVQAKRYANDNPIGGPAIQAFVGALVGKGATKGVFVTTGRFTRQARDAAAMSKGTHRLVLIDGNELADLMIDHDVGVRTVRTILVRRVDLEEYEETDVAL